MERFMTERQIKQFEQEYFDHCMRTSRRSRMVTDTDMMILHDYRKGMGIRELSRKYRVGLGPITTSLRVAALSKL
jgi:Mor family transcriptional regulator